MTRLKDSSARIVSLWLVGLLALFMGAQRRGVSGFFGLFETFFIFGIGVLDVYAVSKALQVLKNRQRDVSSSLISFVLCSVCVFGNVFLLFSGFWRVVVLQSVFACLLLSLGALIVVWRK